MGRKAKIKVGNVVEYLGRECLVVGVIGDWLSLVDNDGAEFFISQGYVKKIR